MIKSDLQRFPLQLLGIFEKFTIGQSPKHSSRIGVLAYASDVKVLFDLNNNTNFNDLEKILLKLQNEYQANNSGGNILGALRAAQNLLQSQGSYRVKTIVLTAAGYNPISFGNPEQIAQDLKNDGVSIITIAYDGVGGIAPHLGNLSSPGYSFKSSDQDLILAVDTAFAQINCFCPTRTLQLQIYDGKTQRFTRYADCLNTYEGNSDPAFGQFFCTPGVVLTAAGYNPISFGNPEQIAQDLKNDGVSIITIAYDGVGGIAPHLGNLSSPGYSFKSSDQDLILAVDTAFAQINCFCPTRTLQLQIYDGKTQRFTRYADCLNMYDGNSDPAFGQFFCTPGVLASVTSNVKLDFIVENVLSSTIKNITVGAFNNNGWRWYNYNDTSYPVGNFPTIPSPSSGLYGYFSNYQGFNWRFGVNSGGEDNAMPYVCQYRACDADYFCDLTSSKAAINRRQKH
uniref:VWFA domain-containing protein n=1 Tax=Panagrolaimus sp. JU765 TaxID=591449 RepID=A0AC34QG64_9BILA